MTSGRLGLAALLLLVLALGSGCALSGTVARQAIAFNESIEVAANTLLLRNVLRARDNAPLHFTAVPQIRGSLSVGVSQPGLGVPLGTGAIRAGSDLSVGVQALTSPSFDVASLDTQEFTRGLLEPIEPQLYRYFAERGFAEQLLTLLLIESASDPRTGGRLPNDPRCWFERPDCPERVSAALVEQVFLTAGGRGRYYFHEYTSLVPVGPSLSAAEARGADILGMVADGKFVLRPIPSGRFQLYREEQRQAICRRPDRPEEAGGRPTGPSQNQACGRPVMVEHPRMPGQEDAEESSVRIQTRSVADIFRFLGHVVRVQEEMPLGQGERLRCLAIPVRPPLPGERPREACLFHITRNPDDVIPSGVAFTFEHQGQTWRVPAFAEPAPDGSTRGDYTLRVLAMVTELLNLKKNSNAIPATRAVQLVR